MPDYDEPRHQRAVQLLDFLASDPENANLLVDAVTAAIDAGLLTEARTALSQVPLDVAQPQILNLRALVELHAGHADAAQPYLEQVLKIAPDEPNVRFNLAWVYATQSRHSDALALLSEEQAAELPQSAALFVQLLHDNGDFDAADECARKFLERYPTDRGLLAAASVLALDLNHIGAARDYASRAGGHPDALTTLGVIMVSDNNLEGALQAFDQALRKSSASPRAWIGRGLAELAKGQNEKAAADIERGAELFADHSGSWIAAGWAHLLSSNIETAKRNFEQAARVDRNFSEPHGSLAVVAAMQGNSEEARRLAEIATRLDPKSFSGAMANALILAGNGASTQAQKVLEDALDAPVSPDGQTLKAAIAKFALSI